MTQQLVFVPVQPVGNAVVLRTLDWSTVYVNPAIVLVPVADTVYALADRLEQLKVN